MIRSLYAVLLLLSISSCRKADLPDPARLDLHDVRSVTLKSGDQDILMVTGFQYTPEEFLIVDLLYAKQAFAFDHDGNLKYLIGRTGQGPGEYSFAGGIYKSGGLIHLGTGSMQQNIYDADGVFIKKVDVPAKLSSGFYCEGPVPGSVFTTNYTRYADNSLFLVMPDGRVTKEFAPIDDDFGNAFDTFFPQGGIFRSGDQLVQYSNHRYELIFRNLDGVVTNRVKLASRRYVEPDYKKAARVGGIEEERAFRRTFTLFSGCYPWKEGYVTELRRSVDKSTTRGIIEFWNREFEQMGWLEAPEEQKLLGVVPEDRTLIFFSAENDASRLIFKQARKPI
ncbi:MAG: 6-bladed beta-propeller [Acidobacteriota bacterium]|nr:6-bladed beta-propeller [Acidobacteriota bacterium]